MHFGARWSNVCKYSCSIFALTSNCLIPILGAKKITFLYCHCSDQMLGLKIANGKNFTTLKQVNQLVIVKKKVNLWLIKGKSTCNCKTGKSYCVNEIYLASDSVAHVISYGNKVWPFVETSFIKSSFHLKLYFTQNFILCLQLIYQIFLQLKE